MADAISELGYTLQHIAGQLTKEVDQRLQERLGMGYAQYKLLRELQDKPYMKQKDIAANLSQTEASISRQVKLMIKQGLLHTTRNPRNRREHLTQVTAKGDRLASAATKIIDQYHTTIFTNLGDKQVARAYEIFEPIHAKIFHLGDAATHILEHS